MIQHATITEKYGNKATHKLTKTRRAHIRTNPIKSTYQHKWIWEAEDGSEWTPMCGEWRKVIDRKHWGTVVGKEASDYFMDRAVNA